MRVCNTLITFKFAAFSIRAENLIGWFQVSSSIQSVGQAAGQGLVIGGENHRAADGLTNATGTLAK